MTHTLETARVSALASLMMAALPLVALAAVAFNFVGA